MACPGTRTSIRPPSSLWPTATRACDINRTASKTEEVEPNYQTLRTAAARSDHLQLLNLPNEILAHIFSFLDAPSPFEVQFSEQPQVLGPKATPRPLKQVSCVSHRFRSLVLPVLLRHACLDPYRLTAFLEFVDTNNLSHLISSIVARLQGPCNHLHPAWWARLLNKIPATTLSIIAAPNVFAELAGTSMWGSDSWAFNMALQTIQLKQSPEAATQHISYSNLPNILVARPWTSFAVNEGSSLKAYTTYEYFLRRTPSLLSCLHHSKSVDAERMFSQLQRFHFVSIFPFYNHVDEILKCVRKMTSIKVLQIQLCPEPDSTVLNDEIEEAQGHMDVNDPWNEFETSASLVAHTCIFLTFNGMLEELRMDDVKMEGIRQSLEDQMNVRLQQWWTYHRFGVWRKTKNLEGQPHHPANLA